MWYFCKARSGRVEVACWTVDREIRVDSRHSLTACGPSNGKKVKDVFGRPSAQVGVGSERWRSLAAHGVGFPAAGLHLETGQLLRQYRWMWR